MNALPFLAPPPYYLEIGHDFVKASGAAGGLELQIERQPGGRLTPSAKERLTLALQSFLKRKPWQPRARVLCAISARGVTLRRLKLPAASKENLQKLLRLQIESEFPLPPDELAWGYRAVHEIAPSPGLAQSDAPNVNAMTGQQELLVVAVKKEVVEEYSELLTACGASPAFTLAALARSRLCAQQPGIYAMLDIGPNQSELMSFVDGIPTAVRVLPWGSDVVTRALEGQLGLSRVEAERLSLNLAPAGSGEVAHKMQTVVDAALAPLAAVMNGSVRNLYLTGPSVPALELAPRLAKQLGNRVDCQSLEKTGGQGPSAAILGLRQAVEQNGALPLLSLQAKPTNGSSRLPRTIAWESAKPILALVLALICLPFAEALVLKPFLAHKLASLKANKGRLLAIDRELGFLQYLKQNQSPYLDAMFLLAKSAPPGAHIDSLSMNRHGDLTLRISMREPTQAVEFRSKLVDSGFFSNVAVEEQAPSPDRQKLNVRLSAQWKAASARDTLALGPTAEEIEKAKTNKNRAATSGPMMPMPFPMGGPGPPPVPVELNSPKGPPMPAPRRSPARPGSIKLPADAGANEGAK